MDISDFVVTGAHIDPNATKWHSWRISVTYAPVPVLDIHTPDRGEEPD